MDEPARTNPHWSGRWSPLLQPLLLLAIVAGIYLCRLTTLPVRGEESRWARVAVNMIEFGDWVVPRQQGLPYIDRPPLAQWVIAGVGLLVGEVDLLAIRLPSVLSVIALSLLIYAYGQTFLTRWGAFTAGLVFATFGQVLQIGRLGENEALYALVVASSLLGWSWIYQRRGSRYAAWMLGYGFAALGALIKGPQAPAYFVAASGIYLLAKRDWRWLIGWHQAAGLATFTAVFAIWQIPFYWATDWETTIGMWTRTTAYRYAANGLWHHVATYPLETLACLLPWSPMLLGYLRPSVRRHLGGWPDQIVFLMLAIAVTYPTVWLAAGARGRYFMPLYPCFALLIAFVIERSALAASRTPARRGWNLFLTVLAAVIVCAGCGLWLISAGIISAAAEAAQPIGFATAMLVASLAAAWILHAARRRESRLSAQLAVVTLAVYLGVAYSGAVINADQRRANDLTETIGKLKQQLDAPQQLVSFGPIDHRFAYYYRDFIAEYEWPESPDEVPGGVRWFCYSYHRGDTPEKRSNGRGMYWSSTSGTLPFAWEEVARIPCDRHHREDPQVTVIVGRMLPASRYSVPSPSDQPRLANGLPAAGGDRPAKHQ